MNILINFFFFGEIIIIINIFLFLIYILLRQNILSYDLNTNLIYKKNYRVNMNFFYFSLFNLMLFLFFLFFIFEYDFFSFFFSLYTTEFINLLKIFILFFVILILLVSFDYINKDFNFQGFEFFLMINLSLIGSLLLISANDFITFYLSLELQSLSFYVLAAFKQVSIFSIEAGLKYFVLGSFSSGVFIFGSSVLYGVFGLYNFSDLYFLFKYNDFFLLTNNFINLGLIFIIITILFKISAVPFHIWVPDVYEGSPTIITFFFSIVPKVVFLGFLIRLIIQILEFSIGNVIFYLLVSASIASLIFGSLVTLIQKKIKRLFAYSSIANVGFLLMGPATVTLDGINASLLYLFFYSLILVVLFYLFISVRYLHNKLKIKNLTELFGFLTNNFFICLFILINLFSLIGMPPLSGFFGKFYLFMVSFGSSIEILFLSGLYASIISAVVYLKLIRLVFFNKTIYFFSYFFNYYLISFVLTIVTIINLFFFLNPNIIFNFIYNITLTLT
jgi:NADH-quinone oxidoreductase subunit N